MGLADFLATAGNHTAIGQIAQAFGGQTDQKRALDDFINNQLPTIADSINKATTRDDVVKGMQQLIGSGLKVGIPADKLDKVNEMLVKPALQGLQQNEIGKIVADYSPKSEMKPTLEPVQEGQPPLAPQEVTTPAREFDQAGALQLGKALGSNATGFSTLLQTPRKSSQEQVKSSKEQIKQTMLNSLS